MCFSWLADLADLSVFFLQRKSLMTLGLNDDVGRLKLFLSVHTDQQLVPQTYNQPTMQQLHSQIAQLPEDVRSGFAQVLSALTGSKARAQSSSKAYLGNINSNYLRGFTYLRRYACLSIFDDPIHCAAQTDVSFLFICGF